MPGEEIGLADALSREESKRSETVVENGRQSDVEGCGGATPTYVQEEECPSGELQQGVPGPRTCEQ